MLSGCGAREKLADTAAPTLTTKACPPDKGPVVTAFGAAGVRGAYHYVTERGGKGDMKALLRGMEKNGFNLFPMTVDINGKATLFAFGPAVLRTQGEVDAEFRLACGLASGGIYLNNIRYNPADDESGSVRVR